MATINEEEVQLILETIWSSANNINHEPARAYARWRVLYEFRNENAENAASLEYAAAEHFALAQYYVATGKYSNAQVCAMIKGYETMKHLGMGKKMEHSDKPTVPYSEVIEQWGYRGAQSGQLLRIKYGITEPAAFRPVDISINENGKSVTKILNPLAAGYEWCSNTVTTSKQILGELFPIGPVGTTLISPF